MPCEGESIHRSMPTRAWYERHVRDPVAKPPLPRREAIDRLHAALVAERRLVQCCEKALQCACDPSLVAAWRSRLGQALARSAALAELLDGVDPHSRRDPEETPNCLVDAMELALRNGDPEAAQAVARECMLLAESQCADARERWEVSRRAALVYGSGAD